uniref:Uncharacterized protein n=1 Tax=viral metagenome TaxID=1070528 RepID=A0A6M3L9C0_9ZZZZ
MNDLSKNKFMVICECKNTINVEGTGTEIVTECKKCKRKIGICLHIGMAPVKLLPSNIKKANAIKDDSSALSEKIRAISKEVDKLIRRAQRIGINCDCSREEYESSGGLEAALDELKYEISEYLTNDGSYSGFIY